MLRLKTDALERHANEFYFQGKLFTGIAFENIDGRVTDAFYVLNGVRYKDYTGDYVKVRPGDRRLTTNGEGLQGEREYDEVITLNGNPYDGVLYEFEDIFCTREAAYEKGVEKAVSVKWYRNGTLRGYDNFAKGVGDAFNWYENRQLKSIYTVKVPHVNLSADFSEDGSLEHLGIHHKDFFATKRSVPNDSPFSTIIESADLTRYRISRKLHLGLVGVTSEVFYVLAAGGKFGELEVFSSVHTSLGDQEFAHVAALPNIRKISVIDDTGIYTDTLRYLKDTRPEVEVEYNHKEFR